MDKKDKALLSLLDAIPRMQENLIAKKLKVSQQVVSYRMKQLSEFSIIYGTIINHSMLGFLRYHVLLQAGKLSKEDYSKLVSHVKQQKNIHWFARTGGKWDLSIILYARSHSDFEKYMDGLFAKFNLQDYDALYVTQHHLFSHAYLNKNKQAQIITESSKIKTDELDNKILSIVAKNCRTSFLEIAKQTGVNYKTVQYRIKSMQEKKLILGHRLFLSSQKFNQQPYLIALSYKRYGFAEEKKLLGYLQQHVYITQASKVFGAYSLLLFVSVPTVEELQGLVNEIRNQFHSIGTYEIIPIFEDYKINLLPQSDS